MTPIQTEIKKALDAMGERSKFTDAILAKRLRDVSKIDGKKKSVIALSDLLVAIESLSEEKSKIFSVTVTNANDLLIERTDSMKDITLESKQRRQRHEKSQTIFTSGDLSVKEKVAKGKTKESKRTERKSLNIYSNYEDE